MFPTTGKSLVGSHLNFAVLGFTCNQDKYECLVKHSYVNFQCQGQQYSLNTMGICSAGWHWIYCWSRKELMTRRHPQTLLQSLSHVQCEWTGGPFLEAAGWQWLQRPGVLEAGRPGSCTFTLVLCTGHRGEIHGKQSSGLKSCFFRPAPCAHPPALPLQIDLTLGWENLVGWGWLSLEAHFICLSHLGK